MITKQQSGICRAKGKTTEGSQIGCGNPTTNATGYCYQHPDGKIGGKHATVPSINGVVLGEANIVDNPIITDEEIRVRANVPASTKPDRKKVHRRFLDASWKTQMAVVAPVYGAMGAGLGSFANNVSTTTGMAVGGAAAAGLILVSFPIANYVYKRWL